MPSDFKVPEPVPDGFRCLCRPEGSDDWITVTFRRGFFEDNYGETPSEGIADFAPIPGREWRKLSEAPELFKRVRVLVECDDQRWVDDARLDTDGWHLLGPTWTDMDSHHVEDPWHVLAWKPAESTELDWENEHG